MGAISRTMKSVFFPSSFCRRMMSTSFSSSTGHKNKDLFLVSRFTHETNTRYFSLVSTESWATVRDFHSPHFGPPFGCSVGINMSSCEGLVLLDHAPSDERLWNPWTNDFKLLPPSYVPRPPNKAFYTSSAALGFGFDSKSRDYKIIRYVQNYFEDNICQYEQDGQLQIELYSLKNDSWKEISENPAYPYFSSRFPFSFYNLHLLWKEILDDPTHPYSTSDRLSSWRSCYANGCCYWTTMKNNVLSFDFANESFSCFSLPETGLFEFVWDFRSRRIDGPQCEYELVEFDGSLGVIVYVSSRKSISSREPQEFLGGLDGELWVWNNESWNRKFEIHVAGVGLPRILGYSSDNQLLFLRGEGRCIGREFTSLKISQLLAYDLHTQQVKKFDIFDYSDEQDMKVFSYFESEVDLNGKSGIFDINDYYDDCDMEAYFDNKDASNGKSRICDA